MTVKLIALNLDDNTNFAEEGISAFDAETALKKASGSDAEIVTVSAQCYRALQHELVNIDKRKQIRYTVTSDGAEIRDAEGGNVLYNRYILEDEARKVKEALKKMDVMVEVYVNGKAYIERNYYEKIRRGEINYRDRSYVLETRVPVRGVMQLLDVHSRRIEKVMVYFAGESVKRKVLDALSIVKYTGAAMPGKNSIKLIAVNCSKTEALSALCSKLNISLSDVMSIGSEKII